MIYLIVGRTGSGKDYFAKLLENKGLKFVKSYTTRPKRDINEDTHIFINKEEAASYTDKIAITHINGYEYFATASQVNNSDAYIIDPNGLYELLQNMPDTEFKIVYIDAYDNDLRKEMAINRSNNIEKESEIFDKRDKDENEQFTLFEYKLQSIKKDSDIQKVFSKNVSNVITIINDYNLDTANRHVDYLMNSL